MAVRVEFYGIPRARAGLSTMEIDADNLGQAVEELATRLPDLAAACFQQGKLRPGFLASINGTTFTTDPQTPLTSGDSLLILSADVGG